jgi:hypothetical protein
MAKIQLRASAAAVVNTSKAESAEASKLLLKALQDRQSSWRWKCERKWAGRVFDLWCSDLYLGVNLDGPGGPEFIGKRTLLLHFTQEEVLEEEWHVVQIIEGALASQEALGKMFGRY